MSTTSLCVEVASTDYHHRYEGLPPNFTLRDNMLAGAFAGIAVSTCSTPVICSQEIADSLQEHTVMYPIDLLKVREPPIDPGLKPANAYRPVCKSSIPHPAPCIPALEML